MLILLRQYGQSHQLFAFILYMLVVFLTFVINMEVFLYFVGVA